MERHQKVQAIRAATEAALESYESRRAAKASSTAELEHNMALALKREAEWQREARRLLFLD